MSIYTTKFQNLVREYGDPQDNLMTKIDLMRHDFFNFDYPTPDSVNTGEFRQYFERLFITHFFNDEFAFETVDYFKLQLMSKMWELMPTYSQRLNILYTITRDTFFNETHTHSNGTNVNGERVTTNTNGERVTTNTNGERVTTNTNGERVTDVENTDVSSDLPINIITTDNIDDIQYASYGKKDKSKTTQHSVTDTSRQESVTDTSRQESVTDTSRQESVTDTSENDTHTISGNLFQYLGQYNKEIAPVISELLKEFESLFMWVW